MFPILDPTQAVSSPDETPKPVKVPELEPSECNLGSVMRLREEALQGEHQGKSSHSSPWSRCSRSSFTELSEIMRKHVFVGIVDLRRCLSLIQYAKKLYLVNHGALA